jgi:hypothetical protein
MHLRLVDQVDVEAEAKAAQLEAENRALQAELEQLKGKGEPLPEIDPAQLPSVVLVTGRDGRERAVLRPNPPPGDIAKYVAFLFNAMSHAYPAETDMVRAARDAVLNAAAPQAALMGIFMVGVHMGIDPNVSLLEQLASMLESRREGGRGHRKLTPADDEALLAYYASTGGARGAIAKTAREFGVSPTTVRRKISNLTS